MKNITIIALFIVLITSCAEKKIHPKEVKTKENITYVNNEPLTDKVWSEDNKTVCLTLKDGKLIDVKAFHEDGKTIAITIEDAIADNIKYFDEKGKEMDGNKFNRKYQKIYPLLVRTLVESGH